MKGRSTLVLLISIFVLGAFIWLQETWRASTPSQEYRRVKLFDLDVDTLVSVQFVHTNTVVECVKENGVWMAGGGEAGMGRADVELVQRMIAGLNSMGKGTTITAQHREMRGIEPAEYGFANPTIQIQVVDNQGRRGWQVGRKTPLGDMVYVREVGGRDIYTVPDILLQVVPSQADELRDRTIFFGEMACTRRVEIRGVGGFIQITKGAKSDWLLQQPFAAAAETKEVDLYLERLYRLRVEAFVADNVSDFSVYGLHGETRQISLGVADGSSRMLVLGDEIADQPGYVFARRADDTSVFSLKADVLELLNVIADQFRDAVVLPLPAKKVSYISMEKSGVELELSMDQPGFWSVSKPVSWPADSYAVQDFLQLWDRAVITDFDAKSTDEPEWTLRFGSSELAQTNRISIFPPRGRKDGLLIQRDHDPTIYQINLQNLAEDLFNPLHYKDMLIWHIDPLDINKISIEKDAGARQILERQPDGAFVPVETNTVVRADAGSVARLLNDLEVVMASEYVAHDPRDLSIYGLVDPAVVLRIGFSGTNQLGRILLVGRETAAGYFAMVKGRDVVFLLDKRFVSTVLTNLLADAASVPLATE